MKINENRMSLEAFKANAENVNTIDVLDSVQGGGLFNCHGNSGQAGKKIMDWVTDRVDNAIDSWINP